MDERLRELERAEALAGVEETRERLLIELERYGQVERVELPFCADILRLVPRTEQLGDRGTIWFDPFASSGQWAPPALEIRTVGRCPWDASPVRIPSGAPWAAQPLTLGFPDRREAEWTRISEAVRAGQVRGLVLGRCPVEWLEALADSELEVLGLFDRAVGDDRLAAAARLPNLRRLVINGSGYTTAGLKSLASLSRLELLSVPEVDPAGLAELAACPRLEQLAVTFTELDDAALMTLAALPLRQLCVQGTAFTGAGLEALVGTPLIDLEIGSHPAIDDLAPALAKLRGLRHLQLPRGGGERLIDALGGLSGLRSLGLRGVAADVSLMRIAGLDRLRRLSIAEAVDDQPPDLGVLARLTELTELCLPDARIDSLAVEVVAGLSRLRALDLKGATLPASTAPTLRHLVELERLGLVGTRALERETLAAVAGLPKLRLVNLARAGGRPDLDAVLPELGAALRLERIDLRGTSVAAAVLAGLRADLPGCRVAARPREREAPLPGTDLPADDPGSVPRPAEPGLRGSSRSRLAQAREKLDAGRVDDALEDFDAAVRLGVESSDLHELGDLHRRRGDIPAALAAYRGALEMAPEAHLTRLALAETLFLADLLVEAEAELTTLIETLTGPSGGTELWAGAAHRIYLRRGEARRRLRRFSRAREDAERALGIDPADADALALQRALKSHRPAAGASPAY